MCSSACVLFALLLFRRDCLFDRPVRRPVSLDCAQISVSQFLTEVCVQPTAHEGEFGSAINRPLVVFHSAEGELCQGEDLTQTDIKRICK